MRRFSSFAIHSADSGSTEESRFSVTCNFSSNHSTLWEDKTNQVVNTTPSKPMRRRRDTPKTWLDCTPSNALSTIAAHVASFGQTQHALHLAETGPREKEAVTTALSNQLRLTEGGIRTIATRWAQIFNESAVEIVLDRSEDVSSDELYFCEEESIIRLLGLHTLKSAQIFDETDFLLAAARSNTLRELEIELYDGTPHGFLFEVLSNMNLARLFLSCFCENCPFLNEQHFSHERNAIASSCHNLQSLEIYCECSKYLGYPHPIWNIFPDVKTLRELSIREDANEKLDEHIVQNLQSLESVKISFSTRSFQLANRVGSSVTELVQRNSLMSSEVAQLPAFTKLRKLDVEIPEGSEDQWLISIKPFSSLNELQLRWSPSTKTGNVQYCPDNNCYPKVSDGLLLQIVQGIPNLTKISLLYVAISLNEVVRILHHAGKKLKVFMTSLLHQNESVVSRLYTLIRTVTLSNDGLTRFSVNDRGLTEFLRKEMVMREERHQQGYEAGRRLLIALRRLHLRAPLLDSMDIRVLVSLLIEDSEEAFN